MSVALSTDGTIRLHGSCGQEDAETLLQLLIATPRGPVDWTQCTAAHTAVIQVLLTVRPILLGPPVSADLARWIAPLLADAPP